MSRAKPCPRPVDGEPCGRPKKKGKQACEWHWLLRQSSDVQATYSRQRLANHVRLFNEERRARVPATECPEGERWCAGCQSFVPLFYCSGSRCKACASMAGHASRLEKVYGIDAAEYDRIFKIQGGRCAICRNRPATKRLATDHDHKTGDVRGLLCKRCNHDLLGGGHDSVIVLWRAITYLMSPPAMRAPGFVPSHGLIVESLRRTIEAEEAEAQAKLPEPVAPPF